MTETEYAEQLATLGESVHLHKGTWWRMVRPGFCLPIWRQKVLDTGEAKPNFRYSWLGYTYSCEPSKFNRLPYRIMRRSLVDEEEFDIGQFSSNRRSKIRRGLKRVEIFDNQHVQRFSSQFIDIVKSAYRRTGAGAPDTFYDSHAEEWLTGIKQRASFKDNFFFIAAKEEKAVAYYHCILVDKTMLITAAKSHSDFLKEYPNDALIFHTLNFVSQMDIEEVIFGEFAPSDKNLNQFKIGYGFECFEIPQRQKFRLGLGPALKMLHRQK